MTVRWRKISLTLWRVILTTVVVLVAYEQFFSLPTPHNHTATTGSNNEPAANGLEADGLLTLSPMLKDVIPAVVNITTIGYEKRDAGDADGLRYYLDTPQQ